MPATLRLVACYVKVIIATAAIAGQIAGALYGASAIPAEWLDRLAWRERIERIANDLFDAGAAPSAT